MNYIVYNKRSCVTGKALYDALNEREPSTWRRNMGRGFKYQPNILMRWGNSYLAPRNGATLELNSADAVALATDKGAMMRRFVEVGISVPPVVFPEDFGSLTTIEPRFYRNHADKVFLRNHLVGTDKYSTAFIEKANEYRVHVFNERTLGVYEKIPNPGNTSPIYKDANCSFRRIDVSDEQQRNAIIGVRPLAKEAVRALGLLFGGVDVIRSTDNNLYVLEVNSAPGLNTQNIQRWVDAIYNYINDTEEDEDNNGH